MRETTTLMHKRTAGRRIFPEDSNFNEQEEKAGLKWPGITGCCSQTKTTETFPVKGLWLNCYSLSDHHNESTARRGFKRKSEEHPVIITVCV